MSCRHSRAVAALCAILVFVASLTYRAISQTIMLQRPADREFVIDKAGMIESAHGMLMNETCNRLLSDQSIPIVVVTVESMRQYSYQSMTIEEFAYALYGQWGIGYASKNGKPWNKGVLLVVSRLDRQARIELGDGYGSNKNEECRKIMDNEIIPYFKKEKYSAGILAGVVALDKMAREHEKEGPADWFFSPWFIGSAVLFAGVLLWMIMTRRSGSFLLLRAGAYSVLGLWSYGRVSELVLALLVGGAGLLEFGLVFNKLGWLGGGSGSLYIGNDTYGWRSHGGFSGGGFSGGGFSGGGFSGGGGASGSW